MIYRSLVVHLQSQVLFGYGCDCVDSSAGWSGYELGDVQQVKLAAIEANGAPKKPCLIHTVPGFQTRNHGDGLRLDPIRDGYYRNAFFWIHSYRDSWFIGKEWRTCSQQHHLAYGLLEKLCVLVINHNKISMILNWLNMILVMDYWLKYSDNVRRWMQQNNRWSKRPKDTIPTVASILEFPHHGGVWRLDVCHHWSFVRTNLSRRIRYQSLVTSCNIVCAIPLPWIACEAVGLLRNIAVNHGQLVRFYQSTWRLLIYPLQVCGSLSAWFICSTPRSWL